MIKMSDKLNNLCFPQILFILLYNLSFFVFFLLSDTQNNTILSKFFNNVFTEVGLFYILIFVMYKYTGNIKFKEKVRQIINSWKIPAISTSIVLFLLLLSDFLYRRVINITARGFTDDWIVTSYFFSWFLYFTSLMLLVGLYQLYVMQYKKSLITLFLIPVFYTVMLLVSIKIAF